MLRKQGDEAGVVDGLGEVGDVEVVEAAWLMLGSRAAALVAFVRGHFFVRARSSFSAGGF